MRNQVWHVSILTSSLRKVLPCGSRRADLCYLIRKILNLTTRLEAQIVPDHFCEGKSVVPPPHVVAKVFQNYYVELKNLSSSVRDFATSRPLVSLFFFPFFPLFPPFFPSFSSLFPLPFLFLSLCWSLLTDSSQFAFQRLKLVQELVLAKR